MTTLFISDLHLCSGRPEISRNFFDFLRREAQGAEGLYILGDPFEYWAGDDDLGDPFNRAVIEALAQLVQDGVPIYLMHGNRDFVIGDTFAQASGVTLLPDPTLLSLHGQPTLLMHGDTLCTDDVAYQAFRAQARDPDWQANFLAKPLDERHALANALRAQSEETKADKTPAIMDVSPEAVSHALRQSGCHRLIHGHTHRPALHPLEIDGHMAERWVHPAWYEGAGWLQCDATGCQLVKPPIDQLRGHNT